MNLVFKVEAAFIVLELELVQVMEGRSTANGGLEQFSPNRISLYSGKWMLGRNESRPNGFGTK